MAVKHHQSKNTKLTSQESSSIFFRKSTNHINTMSSESLMISGLRMCLAWREGCESTATEGGTTIAECVELHHYMNSMGFLKTEVVRCLDTLMSNCLLYTSDAADE